jgi:16S rRNA (cytosine1402-N4)-methyltransferase
MQSWSKSLSAMPSPVAVGGLRLTQEFKHEPVMLAEVVELFAPVPPGLVVDATVGGAGHARELLEAHPHLRLLGLDRDTDAIAAAQERLACYGDRQQVVQARFDALGEVVDHEPLSGALFDLGVSSHQLQTPARGFSYRAEGPLDMRMSRESGLTAAELVNTINEDDLVALLVANGETRLARRIARAIISTRPHSSTTELAVVVDAAVPRRGRRPGHPASRVFQALRIEVNEELDVLRPALEQAIELLVPGGRIVVLSYHSGEDRLVKRLFVDAASGGCTCPPGLPCVCGAVPTLRLLNRGARKADPAEVAANPRASSARLRAAEKIQ